MPDYKGAVSYASTGAAIGTSILPGVGTAIGGVLGFLGGLFGESEEEQRQKRKAELMKQIRTAYLQSMEKAAGATMDEAATARQGAARAAAAKGEQGGARAGEIAAAVNPVYRVGGQVRTALGEQFNRNVTEVERGFAERPMEPSWGDVLMNAGQQAVKAYTAIQEMDSLGSEDYKIGEGASPELAAEMNAPAQVQPAELTLSAETPVNPNLPSFQPSYQPPSFSLPTTQYGSNKPEDQGQFGAMQAQQQGGFGGGDNFVQDAYDRVRKTFGRRYTV